MSKVEKQKILTKRSNDYHKQSGYKARTKHRKAHPEKYKKYQGYYYKPAVTMRAEFKEALDELVKRSGMTLSGLFLDAVEKQHGVILRKVDKKK